MALSRLLLKCRGTELQQQLTELVLEATGNYAVPFDNNGPETGQNELPIGPDYANVAAPEYFKYQKGVDLRGFKRNPKEHYGENGVGAVIPTLSDAIIERETSHNARSLFCFFAIKQKSAGHQIAIGQSFPAKDQQRPRLKVRMPLLRHLVATSGAQPQLDKE